MKLQPSAIQAYLALAGLGIAGELGKPWAAIAFGALFFDYLFGAFLQHSREAHAAAARRHVSS